MITSLLIANRGEIACRIIRTVEVYSYADAPTLHIGQSAASGHDGGVQ